jgi:hypothetical protein
MYLRTALSALGLGIVVLVPVGTAPSASAGGPPVIIESSFSGSMSSHPDGHHTAVNFRDPETGNSADWSADYAAAAGTAVKPRLSGPSGMTLAVADIAPSCSNGGGGTGVKVSVADSDGSTIGTVSYLHLAEVGVSVGDTVSTDTVLGTIGGDFAVDSACWTGPHLHVEGYNDSDYSCYYAPETVEPGTAIGRIGGSDVTGRVTPCP